LSKIELIKESVIELREGGSAGQEMVCKLKLRWPGRLHENSHSIHAFITVC
jgi:hypothetical protein